MTRSIHGAKRGATSGNRWQMGRARKQLKRLHGNRASRRSYARSGWLRLKFSSCAPPEASFGRLARRPAWPTARSLTSRSPHHRSRQYANRPRSVEWPRYWPSRSAPSRPAIYPVWLACLIGGFNANAKHELGWTLRYPSRRQDLAEDHGKIRVRSHDRERGAHQCVQRSGAHRIETQRGHCQSRIWSTLPRPDVQTFRRSARIACGCSSSKDVGLLDP